MSKTFLFQVYQFSETVLIQTCLFSINTQFGSILPIDRALSGAITSVQSEQGRDSNEGVLRIPQSYTGSLPSECLVSFTGHSLGALVYTHLFTYIT